MVGRVIRWTLAAFVLSSIAAGIAALVMKRRTTSIGTPESDEVALTAIFEPVEFESTATAFRGGDLLCWFSGTDIDLRGATLDPGGAYLTVRVLFGGGRIIVPDEWQVDLDVTAILGGVGDARPMRARATDAPRLVVDGYVVFGGFAIESHATDLQPVPMAESEPELAAALEV
jgi:predicted membrane protein